MLQRCCWKGYLRAPAVLVASAGSSSCNHPVMSFGVLERKALQRSQETHIGDDTAKVPKGRCEVAEHQVHDIDGKKEHVPEDAPRMHAARPRPSMKLPLTHSGRPRSQAEQIGRCQLHYRDWLGYLPLILQCFRCG